MEKIKKKKCKAADCGNYFTPYKSTDKFCSYGCAQKEQVYKATKPFRKIKPVSDKQKKRNAEYLKLKHEFMSREENKICPITGEPTTDIHHKFSGKDRQKYFLDISTWVAVSRKGHNWIHDNDKLAREKGYLLSDNG